MKSEPLYQTNPDERSRPAAARQRSPASKKVFSAFLLRAPDPFF
jgi:hypothetical protein